MSSDAVVSGGSGRSVREDMIEQTPSGNPLSIWLSGNSVLILSRSYSYFQQMVNAIAAIIQLRNLDVVNLPVTRPHGANLPF